MELKKIQFENGLTISVEKIENSFIFKKVQENGTTKTTDYGKWGNYVAWSTFRQAKHRALQAGLKIKNQWGN